MSREERRVRKRRKVNVAKQKGQQTRRTRGGKKHACMLKRVYMRNQKSLYLFEHEKRSARN